MRIRRNVLAVVFFALLAGCTGGSSSSSSNGVSGDGSPTPRPPLAPVTLGTYEPNATPRAIAAPAKGRYVVHQQFTVDAPEGQFVVDDFVVDPKTVRIRVVDNVGLGGTGIQYRSYSVGEVVQTLKPILAMNGGGATAGGSLPSTLGLVLDSHKVASPLNVANSFASGVFCVKDSGKPGIVKSAKFKPGLWASGLQSGPLVIEPGGVNGMLAEDAQNPMYERYLVGIDKSGLVHFLATSSAHLIDVANFLMGDPAKRQSPYAAALNLSTGDRYSAVYVRDGSIQYTRGNIDVPAAAVIVVEPR